MAAKRSASNELNHDNWDEEQEPEEPGKFKMANKEVLQKRVIKTAKRKLQNNSGPKPAFSGLSFGVDSKGNDAFSFLSKIGSNEANSNTDKDATKVSDCVSQKTTEVTNMSDDRNTQIPKEIENNLSSDNRNAQNSKEITNNLSPKEIYFYKLKVLNFTVTEWILKHVNENANYILSPIFKDYENHLQKIREEREHAESCKGYTSDKFSENKKTIDPVNHKHLFRLDTNQSDASLNETPANKNAFKYVSPSVNLSDNTMQSDVSLDEIPANKNAFRFGMPSVNLSDKAEINKLQIPHPTEGATDKKLTIPFSFKSDLDFKKPSSASVGSTSSKEQNQSKLFKNIEAFDSIKTDKKLEQSESKNGEKSLFTSDYFSLKGDALKNTINNDTSFSFKNVLPKKENEEHGKTNGDDDDEDNQDKSQPSKEVTEDGAVYNKRCKVFFKKDGTFTDRGIGILFLKLVGNENKCQVIIRTDTSLATIVVNFLLTKSIPLQKMGKNNVMVVCCPTIDDSPVPVLLKVKTSEEADELLATLQKYQK